MDTRVAKVLFSVTLMLFIVATQVFCSARRAIADTPIHNSYLQILQSAQPFLSPVKTQPSIAQLQSLLDAAEKYFSAKRQRERHLFNQQNILDRNILLGQSFPLQTPPIRNIVLEIFQKYFSKANINAISRADLIQLRTILRRLKILEQGHLSGVVWLYDSPLPGFSTRHLISIDDLIIKRSLANAVALRKKHQYAAAQKIYKILLKDYAETENGKQVKVLLTSAIVEDYNYQAKVAFAKHEYKKGRAALKEIIVLYPNTKYARDAQEAIDKSVSVSVKYFRSQADKAFHPQGNVGVPQSKARLYYSLMFESEPTGPQADYAYYHWCEALGTEGKIKKAVAKLKKFPLQFPHSELLPKAYFLTGFLLGAAP